MITEEQIISILKSNQTENEYYPCVTFYEYKEVAKEMLKLVNSSNDIQNVSNLYTIEQVEKCIEHWGMCKVEKEHIERFCSAC